METITPKDAFGRDLEGYSHGRLEVQADSIINFEEAFSGVLNPKPGERIPDPMELLTPKEKAAYHKELRGVEWALHVGAVAARTGIFLKRIPERF